MSRKVQGYLLYYWVLGSFGILGVAALSPASLNEPTLRLHACSGRDRMYSGFPYLQRVTTPHH